MNLVVKADIEVEPKEFCDGNDDQANYDGKCIINCIIIIICSSNYVLLLFMVYYYLFIYTFDDAV